MTSRSGSITRSLSVLAAIISLTIAVAVPAGYLLMAYQYIEGRINAEIALSAQAIEELVINNPSSWQFQEIRLQEILERRLDRVNRETRAIRDMQGRIIARTSESIHSPALAFSQPIYDAGIEVASIEIKRSISPLIAETAIICTCSALSGIIIFLLFRSFPLRAVREAYHAVEENEQRLRLALMSGNFGVWDWDIKRNVMIWDDRMYGIYGVSRDSVTADMEVWQNSIHLEDREKFLEDIRAGIPDERGYHAEFRIKHPDGAVRYIRADGIVLRDMDGKASRMIGLNRDITERKCVEEALRESEERHRRIVEASGDGFLVRYGEFIIYANPAALKLFRANQPEDLIGKPYIDLVHPDDRPLSVKRMNRDLDENWIAAPREHRILALDGQVVHVESTGVAFKHRGETHFFGVFRDISERRRADQEKKKLEGQLQQTQKMEAIGTLAGGIAHDFNNILSVIIGTAEIMNFADQMSPSMRTGLDQILAASQRAKQLVGQILAFSRHGKQEKILIDLKFVIKECVEFLRASLPAFIRVRHRMEPDAGTIMADPTQMQQILMNLCTNAGHAMEKDGGVLQINLAGTVLTEEDARMDPEVEPGDYVKLTVADTGHGIEPSVLDRIFDPYFTTKEPGKGTGLGLAVVHGIVKSHGGMIKVQSEVGKGTTFTVFLPQVKGFEKVADMPLQPLARGTEKILFVDDESALVDLNRQMLDGLGYQVETRTSPIEALEAFRQNPQKFDLVITDLAMPHLSGLNLARKILEIRPGMPIILCTGFSEQTNEQAAVAIGIRALLYKPLVMKDIAGAIRKVLDGNKSDMP